MQKKIELMSPAGDFESLISAIDNGADSIYFGIEQLNMRAKSSRNFRAEDMSEIAHICHSRGVKAYITLNTIIYDHDLKFMKTLVEMAFESGIDAIIAMDQAVIIHARKIGIPVHISTQINITNVETLEFYSQFADVAVLSRELSMRQIRHICSQVKSHDIRGPKGELMKIEVFAHGALCMAVSGKCYMSLHTMNSSANRGACLQNCRRKYKVTDLEEGHELVIDNEYIMSPKDLSTIDFLNQLASTGIDIIKIEGRARAPEYVARVTKVYREAIDSIYDKSYSQEKIEEWVKKLDSVYNRGFWGGYYLGKQLGEWTDKSGSSAAQTKVYLGKALHYYPNARIAHFKIESQSLTTGDEILISGPNTGTVESKVEKIMVNDIFVNQAVKGDECTFVLDRPIKRSDKLYKLIPA
ncbi:MAG: U32 family peptidase [Saprospiraceae bacterium]|nr:U32 family peptidase [Saprospiraceae bacterium]